MNALEIMAEASEVCSGDLILDAGCGLGVAAFWLAEKFQTRVVGISNSEANIRRCRELSVRRNLGHLITFETADLLYYCRSENTFDCIWNLESINYLSPKNTYINRVFRMLKPGGVWVSLDRYSGFEGMDPHGPDRGVIRELTGGLYSPDHWEEVSLLEYYMRESGFADVSYADLTKYVLNPPRRRKLLGPATTMAAFSSLLHPAAALSLMRAWRVMHASFALMEQGRMTYGLLRGRKPANLKCRFIGVSDQPPPDNRKDP